VAAGRGINAAGALVRDCTDHTKTQRGMKRLPFTVRRLSSCGNRPEHPAKSDFARQTTMPLAVASVSNVVITVLLTAGSGLAVANFKAAKNFGLSTSVGESRTALAACCLPRSQTADNGQHAVHDTWQSKARPARLTLRTS
jgi:hypothetical protein